MMKGASLFEILVSLGIVLLLVAILSMALAAFRENSRLTEAQSGLLGLIKDARSRTLASVGNTNYGIHFEASQAVLFSGGAYDSLTSSNEPYILPANIEISSINLGGPSEVIFARLTGAASNAGTIVISPITDSAKTRTITVLPSGNIQ